MANELTTKTKDMVALMTDHSLGDLIKPLSHEILLFGSYIAGTSYIDDQSIFDDLKDGDNLVFARLMDAGKYLTARMTDLDKDAPFVRINIDIYLVDF